MIVDIGSMPYSQARRILDYCVENFIDTASTVRILEAFRTLPVPDYIDWTIDVPDEHLTFLALKWT